MSVFPTADERSADSWIAEMDPRLRILAATALALTVVSLHRLPELLLAFGSSALLASTGGLCWRRLARRLLALEGFMLLVLLTLPFTVPGEPWWNVGGLSASEEGLHQAASILLRANTVVLGLLGLMGSMEPVTLGHAAGPVHGPRSLAPYCPSGRAARARRCSLGAESTRPGVALPRWR